MLRLSSSFQCIYVPQHAALLLQSLRLGTDHILYDSHLQYHHVVIMGNLNYRLVADASSTLGQVVLSSKACQESLEQTRDRGMHWSWRGAGYARFWSALDEKRARHDEGEEEVSRLDT